MSYLEKLSSVNELSKEGKILYESCVSLMSCSTLSFCSGTTTARKENTCFFNFSRVYELMVNWCVFFIFFIKIHIVKFTTKGNLTRCTINVDHFNTKFRIE